MSSNQLLSHYLDGYQTIHDFKHHCQSLLPPSLAEFWPVEVLYCCRNTCVVAFVLCSSEQCRKLKPSQMKRKTMIALYVLLLPYNKQTHSNNVEKYIFCFYFLYFFFIFFFNSLYFFILLLLFFFSLLFFKDEYIYVYMYIYIFFV